MVNHILRECSKPEQKEYKTRNDRLGKLIKWELCKRLKPDPITKYMHTPEPVLENRIHKIVSDFDVLMDFLIPDRRPELGITKKVKFQ